MKTVLFLATTTGYQVRMFGEAAQRLDIRLLFATDRCDQLDDPWSDGAIPVRYHQESSTVEAILMAAERTPIDGVLAVGDRPTVAAALAAQVLGLPGNPPDAVTAARDKRLTRARLRDAFLPVPEVHVVSRRADPRLVAPTLGFPVVVKPAALAGSRGVIRANTSSDFVVAFERVRRLLESWEVRELRDPSADDILIESYIPGREFAIEGVLEDGLFQSFAIFDKPDPLEGPFFEETIYVTPSRAGDDIQAAIHHAVMLGTAALGLRHGPVHAECRVNQQGVFILEIAARPIGGLCARALRFVGPDGQTAGLEELLLRHAVGESARGWQREDVASGVMMIPIPEGGIYRGVAGVEEARQVACIDDVRITAKVGQQVMPLPEGASYLGFIFARAARPADVEHALRTAHNRLSFAIDRALPVIADR
jgi:biotin carboxylase